MGLGNGNYLTKVERRVVVWPAPDANGNGAQVWVTQFDREGRQVGRLLEKDKHGNEVRSYKAPEGFENRPGFDHTDNYVMVDERGQIVRQPNGEAIVIQPGQAVVFNPDGSTEVLTDEYAQYMFAQAHNASDDVEVVTDAVSDSDAETVEDPRDARIRELEAQLAGPVK